MKADGSFGMGVVAQDVQEVAPEHVFTDASGHLAIDKAGIALEAVIALAYRVRELEGKA